MEEKRKYVRVPLVVKVTNKKTKEFHFFYSRDISLGGMFLETRDPYPLGSDVELDFFIQAQDRKERVVTNGKVARVQKYDVRAKEQPTPGMGIQFDNADPQALAMIGNFIRLTLGAPD